jgi:hypothetical protein
VLDVADLGEGFVGDVARLLGVNLDDFASATEVAHVAF